MGTDIYVDSFSDGPIPGCTYYVLSHFHSDHYNGLRKGFDWGSIICSKVTGNLIVAVLGVDERFILRVPLGQWTSLGTISVFLEDAAHCPGSAIFIFRIPDKERPDGHRYILHTGDFRASPALIRSKSLIGLSIPKYDAIYLDTTYGDPQYVFPSQSSVIEECCQIVDRLINKQDQRAFSPIRRLVLVGSYLIGKEKVALAVAKLLDSKIYCSPRKRMIFQCLQWEELQSRLTNNPEEAQVHVVGMGDLDADSISALLDSYWPQFTHALAIRPTGWTFRGPCRTVQLTYTDHLKGNCTNNPPVKRKNAIACLALPYSEHSSYDELAMILDAPWLNYDWVIPTVDNPLDLYLRRSEYESGSKLLLAWSQRRKRKGQ